MLSPPRESESNPRSYCISGLACLPTLAPTRNPHRPTGPISPRSAAENATGRPASQDHDRLPARGDRLLPKARRSRQAAPRHPAPQRPAHSPQIAGAARRAECRRSKQPRLDVHSGITHGGSQSTATRMRRRLRDHAQLGAAAVRRSYAHADERALRARMLMRCPVYLVAMAAIVNSAVSFVLGACRHTKSVLVAWYFPA